MKKVATTYHGLGTPNSPGNTASMYQVRIPYNTESMSNMPMAPAKEYLSPVPTKRMGGRVKYSHAFQYVNKLTHQRTAPNVTPSGTLS